MKIGYLLDGYEVTEGEDLELELDVSPLLSRLERYMAGQSSCVITMGQLATLMKSVTILQEDNTQTGSQTLYLDIVLPSDTEQVH